MGHCLPRWPTFHGIQVQYASLALGIRLGHVAWVAHDDEAPVQALMDGHEQVVKVEDVHVLRVCNSDVLHVRNSDVLRMRNSDVLRVCNSGVLRVCNNAPTGFAASLRVRLCVCERMVAYVSGVGGQVGWRGCEHECRGKANQSVYAGHACPKESSARTATPMEPPQ